MIGNDVVDFCSPELRLVIEVDGTRRFPEAGRARDVARDAWLAAQGYWVLRCSNADVNSRFAAVCEDILETCRRRMR